MTPDLIFLNGTSSSGKTSIAQCLQEMLLPALYLNYSIDNILYALPKTVFNRMTTGGDMADISYDSLVDNYYDAGYALLKSGARLIMDDAITTPRVALKLRERFAAFKVVKVGVKCGLEELKLRELRRGDRTVGEAASQFPLVHGHLKYDLEVDTSSTAPELNARHIADFINKNPAP